MCIGDSRTRFGGWQDLLIAGLNQATGRIPSWSIRTNTNERVGNSVSVLGASMSAFLDCPESALAYPTYVLMNFGYADMLGATPNQTTFQNNYLAMVDAVVAKWFNAEIYIDYPWGVLADGNYAAVKGYLQNVIGSRSMCHAGVDQGVTLKGGDNGATYTQDGVHFNSNAAGKTAYAAAMQAAMGY